VKQKSRCNKNNTSRWTVEKFRIISLRVMLGPTQHEVRLAGHRSCLCQEKCLSCLTCLEVTAWCGTKHEKIMSCRHGMPKSHHYVIPTPLLLIYILPTYCSHSQQFPFLSLIYIIRPIIEDLIGFKFCLKYLTFSLPSAPLSFLIQLSLFPIHLYLSPSYFSCIIVFLFSLIPVSRPTKSSIVGQR
jgi:hypothetical protein